MRRSIIALLIALTTAAPISAWTLGSPHMTVDPLNVSFTPRIVGSTGDTRTITIMNALESSSLFYSVEVTGLDPDDFVLSCDGGGLDCLSGEVTAGWHAYVYVSFSPTAEGSRFGAVTVSGNDSSNPFDDVLLDGVATGIFAGDFETGGTAGWICSGCVP